MPTMAPGLMALAAPIVSGDSDADLVAWFCMHPDALELFSVAERERALAILSGKIPLTLEQRRKRHTVPLDKAIEGAVADYLRDRMANGDRVQERERDAARTNPEAIKTQRDFDNGDEIGGWVLVRTTAGEWGIGVAIPAEGSPGWRVADIEWCDSEAQAREGFAFEAKGSEAREANAAADRMFAAMALGRSGNLAVYETPAATMDLMARADGATRAWMPAGDTIEVDEIVIRRGDYTVRIFGIARPRSAS